MTSTTDASSGDDPATMVHRFYSAMQSRDWATAGELVARDAIVHFPSTGESFVGEQFVAMNRDYPEGWSIVVHDVVAAGRRVAARVAVHHDRFVRQVFWCAGFYDVVDGRIARGEELWLTEHAEPAPDWRAPYRL